METTVHQHGKIKYMAIEFRLEKKKSLIKKSSRNKKTCCTAGFQIRSFGSASFHYIVD